MGNNGLYKAASVLVCVTVILIAIVFIGQLDKNKGNIYTESSSDAVVSSAGSSEDAQSFDESSSIAGEPSEESENCSDVSELSEDVSDTESKTVSEESSEESSEETSEEISDEPSEESSEESSEVTDIKDSKKEKPKTLVREEGKKYIAFTFDDGPSLKTPGLLDYLEANGLRVTFFSVGNRLEPNYSTYRNALNRAVNELGCEAGIHAYTHENYFDKCDDKTYIEELEKTEKLIYDCVGYYPIIMRPPGGAISESRRDESEYNIIIWSVDSEDWMYKKRDTEQQAQENINIIVNNILSKAYDGCIVLMHDLYDNSVEAFKIASQRLIEDGYELVTVGELLGLDASSTTGKRYWSVKTFDK